MTTKLTDTYAARHFDVIKLVLATMTIIFFIQVAYPLKYFPANVLINTTLKQESVFSFLKKDSQYIKKM